MRFAPLALAALLLAGAVWAQEPREEAPVEPPEAPTEPGRWLITAGIDEYRDWDIPGRTLGEFYAYSVGYPLMAEDLGGVPVDHASLLGGNLATKANLKQSFDYIAENSGPEDVVLMYFCLAPALTRAEDGSTELVLCPYEADKEDLLGSALTMSRIAEMIQAIPTQKKVLFLDCCLWDPFRPEGLDETAVPADDCYAPLSEACALVMASSPNEKYAEEDLMRPLLGFCLSTAHTGAPLRQSDGAENGDGQLSAAELWRYVELTSAEVYNGAGERQTPMATGVKVGDVRYMNLPEAEPRCPAGMRLVEDEICVDIYESPNRVGAMPTVNKNLFAFTGYCQQQGKRACEPDEWEMACLGPDNYRYSYDEIAQPGACNVGWPDLDAARAERIGSRPLCVNGYGLYDMVGNVGEYVGHGNETSDVRGGSFMDQQIERADCRILGPRHPVQIADDVGMRCCADPR